MRLHCYAAIAAAVLLAACGRPASPTTETATTAQTEASVWVLCDGIDAPTAIVLRGGPPGMASVTEYDKTTGATAAAPYPVNLGPGDGAAGSVYTPLSRDGQEIGHVREVNAGNFENPGSAWTTPFTSVKLGDREIACRWMPRTRLMGITGRRTIVVHEDRDGDLIYTTYDFPGSTAARLVELSENARTTTFSLEVRGGEEHVSPQGAEFVFNNDGYRYTVTARGGVNQLEVRRGDQVVQTEPIIAAVFGTAAQSQGTP